MIIKLTFNRDFHKLFKGTALRPNQIRHQGEHHRKLGTELKIPFNLTVKNHYDKQENIYL